MATSSTSSDSDGHRLGGRMNHAGSDEEICRTPWRYENTRWERKHNNLLDVLNNAKDIPEFFEIMMERDKTISSFLVVWGLLLLAVCDRMMWGLLFTTIGIVWVSGYVRSGLRSLRQYPTVEALLPSSLLMQTKESLRYDVENYIPLDNILQGQTYLPNVNILMMGPIGAGKSSFYNTIHAVLQDRMFNVARSGSTDHSLTKKFSRYPVYSSRKPDPLRLTLCDTTGLEPNHFMSEENMRLLVTGRLSHNFPLDPSGNYPDDCPGVKADAKLHERMHCVVIILDASIIDATESMQDTVNNIKEMQKVATKFDIPQVVVLTCVDKLSAKVSHDVSLVTKSKTVLKAVRTAAEIFGLPRNNVFPMKNYEKESEVDPNVDILTLLTVKGILDQVDAFLLRNLAEIRSDYPKRSEK